MTAVRTVHVVTRATVRPRVAAVGLIEVRIASSPVAPRKFSCLAVVEAGPFARLLLVEARKFSFVACPIAVPVVLPLRAPMEAFVATLLLALEAVHGAVVMGVVTVRARTVGLVEPVVARAIVANSALPMVHLQNGIVTPIP